MSDSTQQNGSRGEPSHTSTPSRDELLTELRALGEQLEKRPTINDMRVEGRFSGYAYQQEFGTWSQALSAGGYELSGVAGREITREELVEELHRIADGTGEVPSRTKMVEQGKYSVKPYQTEFGTWSDALAACGYEPAINQHKQTQQLSQDDLKTELERLSVDLNKTPTSREMASDGQYSVSSYISYFGSWRNALQACGFDPSSDHSTHRVPVGELIEEIISVACEVDQPPYTRQFNEHSKYSAATCKRRFGSWAEALRTAGFPARYRGGTLATSQQQATDPHQSYGENWENARQQTLVRDRYRCQSCGLEYQQAVEEFEKGLAVHHIYPIRTFDEPEAANFTENLITLCPECHQRWEKAGPTAPEIETGVENLTSGSDRR